MATSELLHTAHYILDREFEPHRKPPLACIPAAGIGTQANAISTADCLHFTTRPGTPEHEKKYRQSVLHEPGKIVRHFGTAEDELHPGPFGKQTISKAAESVARYLRVSPETATGQWRQERAEDIYASTKREPLGHGYVRGHVIPDGLGTQVAFGMAIHAKHASRANCGVVAAYLDSFLACTLKELDRAGQAKPIIFPADCPLDSCQSPDHPQHDLYIKSHGAWAAGEQRRRHYDWARTGVDPASHAFGAIAKDRQFQGLKQVLQPELDPATSGAHVTTKAWEDFQLTSKDFLGKPRHLGLGDRAVAEGHTFGVPSARGELGVDALLRGDYSPEQLQADADLGKSVKEGWRNLGPADRVYGVPTIRRDIPAPRHPSIANVSNHGNDPNTMQLLHPTATAERGVNEEHYLRLRPRDEIRDVVVSSGIYLSDQEFEHIFQHSCLEDQRHGATLRQACCIHTFMRMRQEVLAEQMQIDCACIHAHHSR